MAEKKESGGVRLEGQEFEGHGDKTQPAGIQSPATFAPLSGTPESVNTKTDLGKKGK